MVAILLILAIAAATMLVASRPVHDDAPAANRGVLRVDLADRNLDDQ